MKKIKYSVLSWTFLFLPLLFFFTFLFTQPVEAQTSFKFVAWGDTKTATSVLASLSNQAKTLNPNFTIYAGDLVDSWSEARIDTWICSINGSTSCGSSNGIEDITFPVRGNHDSGSGSGAGSSWSNNINQAQTVTSVGATNYSELTKDQTYSFDYANSRFIAVDVLGGADRLSAAQIAWIDQRLTDAETRGLTHAFVYFHGPIYCVDGHCSCSTLTGCMSSAAISLVNVLRSHPVYSGSFHGHEHVNAYVHLNTSRIPEAAGPFEIEEFVTGDAGAGVDGCKANRTNYCMTGAHGFALVTVSGNTFKIDYYKQGGSSPDKTLTFTKGAPPPTTITPTQRPTISPTKTPTPSPTRSPSISPTKTPTPTPTRTGTPTVSPRNTPTTAPTSTSAPTPPNKFRGDADCNGAVNEIDYQIYVSQYKKTPRGCPIDADFNNDGKINAVDYVIWMNTYDTIKPSVTPTPIPSASPSVSPPPGGEVKVEQTVTGKATGNPTSVTSESIDAAAQRLYVASISTKPNRAVSGVSGLGLSWVRSKTQCSGRSQTRTEIWRAYGSPSTSGSVKATFSSSAKPASAVISVTSFSGANPSRLIGAKPSRNTLGVNSTTCTGGTDASSYSFTLNPVSSNSLIYSAVSIRQRTHTPGEGYTELSDFTTDSSSNRVNLDDDDDDDDGSGRSGDAAGIATQYKIINSQSPTIVNGTINHDLDYAAVSIEIIAGQ